MKNIIQRAYHLVWGFFFIMFIVLLAFFRLTIKEDTVKQGFEKVTEYSVTTQKDGSTPLGIKQVYTFTLEELEGTYCQLLFYTIHQNVRVFLEDQSIYVMRAGSFDAAGSSPGCVWNQIAFSEEDNGKTVRVEIAPVYSSSMNLVPTIYLGDRYDIVRWAIIKDLPAILLSLIVIIFGVIYICFVLYGYEKSDIENSLLMLGYFAIQVGVWKLTDMESISLLFPKFPVFSQVPYMALKLLCIPFTMFVKSLYSNEESKIWYVPCIASFADMAICFLLQCLGIADMRQTLIVTHLLFLMIAVMSLVMAVREVRIAGWNEKLKRNVWCLCICLGGAALDMFIYYITHGRMTTVLSMFGFTVYIFVLGRNSMMDLKKLMDIGIRAEQYEKMAYHDELTGLFNRTAFVRRTDDMNFKPDKCIVVMLDLNNLKKCNDTLGHDKGDIYIRESARMIRESFGEIGKCYRTGGDEFCVLIENGDIYLCKQKVQELKNKVAAAEKIADNFRMAIACGYKMYDKRLDYNINDTVRRADKAMYQEKIQMKQEQKEEVR